ncbi:four helix bundle protein [Flavobacterium sp.]|uniref:four helix bundle protein n=1 Tax=Flavobacterium sp. TaxID=239 RepID=UPI0026036C65|nr:four helix bundle protein [Flavobacterium sp.]
MSVKENIIQQKSFAFAVRSINAYKFLTQEKKEFILSKQFLRSATSIGANVEEAIGGQSNADFISKISISYKEARETIYWVRLLKETSYLNESEANSLLEDATEICKILAKIKITMKKDN